MKVTALAPVLTLHSYLFLYSSFRDNALFLGHFILSVGATAPVRVPRSPLSHPFAQCRLRSFLWCLMKRLLRGPNLIYAFTLILKTFFALKSDPSNRSWNRVLLMVWLNPEGKRVMKGHQNRVLPVANLGFSIISNSGLGIPGFIPNKAFQQFLVIRKWWSKWILKWDE